MIQKVYPKDIIYACKLNEKLVYKGQNAVISTNIPKLK